MLGSIIIIIALVHGKCGSDIGVFVSNWMWDRKKYCLDAIYVYQNWRIIIGLIFFCDLQWFYGDFSILMQDFIRGPYVVLYIERYRRVLMGILCNRKCNDYFHIWHTVTPRRLVAKTASIKANYRRLIIHGIESD